MSIPPGSIPGLVARGRDVRATADDRPTSLRETLLDVLTRLGPVADSRDLPRILRAAGARSDDLHNIQSVLASLQRGGLVVYTYKTKGKTKWMANVTLRPTKTNGHAHETTYAVVATGEDAAGTVTQVLQPVGRPETAAEPETGPEPPTPETPPSWPVLDGLRAVAARVAESAVRTTRLMEAAELLADVDPDESARLLGLADQVMGDPFTAIENEYLRYAEQFTIEEKP